MENRKRLNHIESIRAFAALSVAVFHFTNYYNGQRFLIDSESIRSFFKYGAQGVEMFYVISGFIIPYSLYKGRYKIKHYFHYLGKRLSRLLPPYFTTILLITLVSYMLNTYLWGSGFDLKWRQLFANAFFAVDFINTFDLLAQHFPDNTWINPIFETLKVEFQYYLLIGLLFPLFNKNTWFFVLICLALLYLGTQTPQMNTVLVNSPYFILGMVAFYIMEHGWKWEYIFLLFVTLLCLFSFYVTQDFIVGIIGFSAVVWIPTNFKLFNFTGKISYSYYLIHGLTGGWFLYFSSDTWLGINYPYVLILLALLVSWTGAFLMYFCIEKPSLIISKKITYKQ